MRQKTFKCAILFLCAIGSTQASAQWTQKADKTGLCGTQSLNAVSLGNLCYIGAGYSESCVQWHSYNPTTDVWSVLSPYPGTNNVQSVGFAINGKIYVGVGANSQSPAQCDNKLYEYVPSTNTWLLKTTMPGSKRQACSYFVIGNMAYIGMGADSAYKTGYKDFLKYDPALNTWTAVAPFPDSAIIATSCFTAKGKGYVVGGIKQFTTRVPNSRAWSYDPVGNSWNAIAQAPASKAVAASAAVVNDVPFICMGIGTQPGNIGRKNLCRYNIPSDTWVLTDSLPDNRTWDEGIGFALNGRLYFGLGDDLSSGFGLNPMMWEYRPAVSSVEEFTNDLHWSVSPNPTAGYIQITGSGSMVFRTLELYSFAGQKIRSWDQVSTANRIYLGDLPSGVYCLHATTSSGVKGMRQLTIR